MSEATRTTLWDEAARSLREGGIETARLDARLLLQHALGIGHLELLNEAEASVSRDDAARVRALFAARAAGAPLAHLTGAREFWGLAMATGPGALVPRADTETLVEAMLPHVADGALVADLGTGTGCILAALLHERNRAFGIGIDRSGTALTLARENLTRHASGRFALIQGDWAEALCEGLDAIVSNPPYIESGAIAGLAPDVRRDPRLALDGGADGLDAYRALVPSAARALRPGGWIGLEIGRGQEPAVAALLDGAGFARIDSADDLAGITRVVLGRKGG